MHRSTDSHDSRQDMINGLAGLDIKARDEVLLHYFLKYYFGIIDLTIYIDKFLFVSTFYVIDLANDKGFLYF